jgi:YegS/Rv2252/BmrU family lipid kinase
VSQRALFIVNPVARGAPSVEKLRQALAWLEGRGWQAELTSTEQKGHATDLARQAAREGLDTVVACGGDGTVNEVANGLALSDTALAVIRGGTANVWAKEVRIPRDPLKAVRVLCEGERRRIDLGLAEPSTGVDGGRYFLLMAGVGLDGHIVSRVPDDLKQRLGAAAYILHGLREALRYRSSETTVIIDGEPLAVDLCWLLVGNTRSYGGVVNITHRARADDGLLDVYVFAGHGFWRMVAHGLRILARRHDRGPKLFYRRAQTVELPGPCALPVQIDGDYLGLAPLRMRVVPGALSVLVPAGLKSPLFQKTAVDAG